MTQEELKALKLELLQISQKTSIGPEGVIAIAEKYLQFVLREEPLPAGSEVLKKVAAKK